MHDETEAPLDVLEAFQDDDVSDVLVARSGSATSGNFRGRPTSLDYSANQRRTLRWQSWLI